MVDDEKEVIDLRFLFVRRTGKMPFPLSFSMFVRSLARFCAKTENVPSQKFNFVGGKSKPPVTTYLNNISFHHVVQLLKPLLSPCLLRTKERDGTQRNPSGLVSSRYRSSVVVVPPIDISPFSTYTIHSQISK